MAVANCPSCGGAIEFKIGSSVVLVCDYCRTVVARTDRGLEDLGKVAALVDTGSPLRRGLTGRILSGGFRIVGRTQMRHPMGGTWDEWYAALDNGQWGWIAEAQGKYYLTTRTTKQNLPPYEVLQIGGTYDGMAVVELATAAVVSGEGEIPFRVEPGSSYQYADLSGSNRRFGTIDYSEDPPVLFEGEETTLADLGIDVAHEPARATHIRVEKLSCSQCGSALTLVAPDQSERVICPHCGASHDVTAGNLRYLQTLKRTGPQPVIPLGGTGKIGDEEYIAAGFMQRSVTFDKKYFWTEYLLFAPRTKSFAWLVDDDGHWSFVVPLSPGEVTDAERGGAAPRIESGQTTFAIFQDAVATVESVIGEFYWKVEVGETARGIDYIAPPEGISKEISDTAGSHEVNYSHARYMPPEELETAFGITGLPRPTKIGTLQPARKAGCVLGWVWVVLVITLVAATCFVGRKLPDRLVLSESYPLDEFAASDEGKTSTAAQSTTTGGAQQSTTIAHSQTATDTNPSQTAAPADWSQPSTTTVSSTATDTSQQSTTTGTSPESGGAETSAVIFTKPFVVNGGHNLELEASTNLSDAWLHVNGALFNEQSGFVEPFQMQLEHYEGVDEGEHWSEGSLTDTKSFSTMRPGTYSLRIETYRDAAKPAPVLKIAVHEGTSPSSGVLFDLAFVLISIPPLLMWLFNRGGGESERWADAMFTPQGQRKGDD